MAQTENKRIAKNTLLLYFRSILLILVALYTSRVILDALGVSDYGIYNIVGGVVTSLSILGTAMASATQRFITFALGKKNPVHLKDVFQTSVTLHMVLGVITVVVLEIVGLYLLYYHLNIPISRMSAAFWTMQCSIAVLFITFIAVPYNSLIIAHEKMGAFAYISLLDGFFKLGIAFLLSFATVDKLILYAILLMFVAIVQRLLYTIYCRRHFEESVKLKYKINRTLFKEMFTFSAWNLLGNGSMVLRNLGIDILMNIFFGVTVNAAKGVCNQVQSAIYQFVSNFQTAVNPQLTKSIAMTDYQRSHQLVIQGSRFSFYLLSIFSIPLIIFADNVLGIWLVKTPEYTVEFIRWTFIYLQFDCISRFLINSILATGNIRTYQIIVSGAKFLALPLTYFFFICWKNPVGGIWVNIILEICCLLLRLYFNNKQVGLKYSSFLLKVVFKGWLVFGMSLGVAYFATAYVGLNFIIGIFISVLVTLGMIYLLGLTGSEKHMIIEKISFFVNKKIHHE